MGVPASQAWTVTSYVLKQKLLGRKRYPLVLMLEPLFRCNLACAGCGKIQYPPQLLKKSMPVDEALAAADECGAPMVSIAGGEPLMHPQIGEIANGLVEKKKYIYLCTNAILLEKKLQEGIFKPSNFFSFSVHVDGLEEDHDEAVCRDGVYEQAIAGIRAAVDQGFRVTTNTTLFDNSNPLRIRDFFDEMTTLGVDGMMVSPGYSYSKAPDQDHFLRRERTNTLFSEILGNKNQGWRFNQSPLFLQYLMGKQDFECTPWGNPLYNIFGWQRPCYLLQEGYAASFEDLLEKTDWDSYGRASGNPKCQDCMVHCGHEPTAVDATFSFSGMRDTILTQLTGKL